MDQVVGQDLQLQPIPEPMPRPTKYPIDEFPPQLTGGKADKLTMQLRDFVPRAVGTCLCLDDVYDGNTLCERRRAV